MTYLQLDRMAADLSAVVAENFEVPSGPSVRPQLPWLCAGPYRSQRRCLCSEVPILMCQVKCFHRTGRGHPTEIVFYGLLSGAGLARYAYSVAFGRIHLMQKGYSPAGGEWERERSRGGTFCSAASCELSHTLVQWRQAAGRWR